ncbi:response regulator [Salmonella enterica]|nr:response regulator [Salmonella enterica]
MQQPQVWLVEDEQGIADTLIYTLQLEGFTVELFARGLPALEKARQQRPDAVILDVGLPDISGFELCRQLLERHPALPILFLTARSDEVDRLLGLEIGADDYVAKPFSPLSLTRYEFLLLKTLLLSPERVYSRQQLMDIVWSDAQETFDRTVDTHIKTLRAKLRAINPDLSPINTHRGMGYSLRSI